MSIGDKSKWTRVKKEDFEVDQQVRPTGTVDIPIKFIKNELKMVESQLKHLAKDYH